MLRIRTASRLHFGLLGLPAEETVSPDPSAKPPLRARRFGGVGMMIESPGLVLCAEPAPVWSAEGPLAERALAFAHRFYRSLEAAGDLPPQRLRVEAAPREHGGLGTGTQLGMATARILSEAWGLDFPIHELARRVQRGARSALGVHGFAHGGVLVDGGKGPDTELAPLVARAEFPEAWRVVLVLPRGAAGLHGGGEQAAFAQLACDRRITETLCRIVLLGILPALAEEDLPAFGEALFDFNARVGEVFAPVQGGVYASPVAADVIDFVRRQGAAGVAQSSWGPGVFAVIEEERAGPLANRIRDFLGADAADVCISRGCNRGASVEDG